MSKKVFIILGVLSFLTASSIMAQVDSDGDGIFDDGDNSGVVGDSPCSHMNTDNCDDNCPDVYNPDQYDGNYDGIGDACCCELAGDANDDGQVNILDIIEYIWCVYNSKYCNFPCLNQADANGNCTINILDVTCLIAFLYKGGSAPVCGCVY